MTVASEGPATGGDGAAAGRVRLDRVDAVALITISRPDKHNALSLEMWGQLRDAAVEAAADGAVRAVIVRGEGREAFSAGADISEFAASRSTAADAERYASLLEEAELALIGARKPTIAMIHGICIGGGAGIALACSLRFADDAFRFAIPAAKLGVVYHQTAVDRLVQASGPRVALDLLMSGRELNAAEAYRCGLIAAPLPADELEQATLDYARTIAARAPLSVEGAWVGVALALAPGDAELRREIDRLQRAAIESEDYREGVRAFAEKRRPRFSGR